VQQHPAGNGPAACERQPVYDDELNSLEDGLRRLKVEYDIFFNGHRKKPPDDLRMRVERIVKKLSECPDMNFQQRFRYNTLIARFYLFRDLWRRTQQSREQSDDGREEARTPTPATPAQDDRKIHISLADPMVEEEKVRQLYEALLRMRGMHAKEMQRLSYAQFATYITDKTRNIRDRSGCSAVRFTIALEDQTLKFTAKAENGR
jgi:hypothetical protein